MCLKQGAYLYGVHTHIISSICSEVASVAKTSQYNNCNYHKKKFDVHFAPETQFYVMKHICYGLRFVLVPVPTFANIIYRSSKN